MNMKNPAILTAGAFLSAWAASNFAADYRSDSLGSLGWRIRIRNS